MSKGIDEFDNSWYEIDDQFNTIATNRQNRFVFSNAFSKANVNKNADITFMGDSMLDCKAYTGTNKGTVDYLIEQIPANFRNDYRKRVNDISVDGFTIPDCLDVVNNVYGKAVVISAGGNDLLAKMDLLKVSNDTNITMGIMRAEINKLSNAFETLLHQLRQSGRKFLIITPYEGNLAYNPQRFHNIDDIALSVLSMWNDRLYRLANEHNNRNNRIGQEYHVLDTRTFMKPNCFYNEIEPNDIGAKRIAKNINKWLYTNQVW